MAEMRLDLGGGGGADDLDDPRDQLQREWTANPYTKAHNLRRLDVVSESFPLFLNIDLSYLMVQSKNKCIGNSLK